MSINNVWQSLSKDFIPVHLIGEDFLVKPMLVIPFKLLTKLHLLAKHTQNTIVHWFEIRVSPIGSIASVVEPVDTCP